MSYVNSLRDGAPVAEIVKDAEARLYRRHAEDGPGRLCVGMLPQGEVLLYEQSFDGGELSVMRKGTTRPLRSAETPSLLAALTLLDRKIERHGLS